MRAKDVPQLASVLSCERVLAAGPRLLPRGSYECVSLRDQSGLGDQDASLIFCMNLVSGTWKMLEGRLRVEQSGSGQGG